MRLADDWFRVYAKSHQNPTNKKIHYICVPLIFWSVLAMLWRLQWPTETFGPLLNGAVLLTIAGLAFYWNLGLKYFVRMLGPVAVALGLCAWMDANGLPLFSVALGIFVVAWIGQFIGHHIEGQRPSFIDDLFFLMIGPLWIMNSAGEAFARRH